MAIVNRNFRKSEREIFLGAGLERVNRLDAARKIRIRAHAIAAPPQRFAKRLSPIMPPGGQITCGLMPHTSPSSRRRPGSGRDPYRGVHLMNSVSDDLRNDCALGLWVPACAGTTWECGPLHSRCHSGYEITLGCPLPAPRLLLQLNQHQIRPHSIQTAIMQSAARLSPCRLTGNTAWSSNRSSMNGYLGCGFSFMKLSLASSRSTCASIAAAECGVALSSEKSRSSILIFWTGGRRRRFFIEMRRRSGTGSWSACRHLRWLDASLPRSLDGRQTRDPKKIHRSTARFTFQGKTSSRSASPALRAQIRAAPGNLTGMNRAVLATLGPPSGYVAACGSPS